MSKFDNYVFDLYGTLVDIHTNESKKYLWEKSALFYSMNGANYSAAEFKLEYKRICNEELAKIDSVYAEIDLDKVFKQLYENKGITVNSQMIQTTELFFRTISLEYVRLYAGATDLLKKLKEKGKKLYLLSNAQYSFTMPELNYLGIKDLFDGIFISSAIGCKKPGYKFYGHLIRRECLDVNRTIMIGNDIDSDIIGAKKMGMSTFYIHSNLSPKGDSLDKACSDYKAEMTKAYKLILKTLDE